MGPASSPHSGSVLYVLTAAHVLKRGVVEDVTITGAPEAALSPSGTLVYKRGQLRQRLVLVDPAGAVHQVTAEERNFLAFYGGRPTLSPDGRRVAVNLAAQRGDSITVDIWTIDRHTGTFARLTSLGDVMNPEWTPDGKHLVFSTWESRRPKLWRQLADGSEPAETLLALPDGYQIIRANVTPDGNGITYCVRRIHVKSRPELFYLPLAGDRKPERVDAGPLAGLPCAARVSPDGRWLAYVGSDGATTNVYVRSFRGAAGPVQISADGGDSPIWSRDGKRLYYRRIEAGLTSGSLVVAHVSPTTTGLHVVKRERILTLREGGVYDVAPDGRQVLVAQQGDSRVQLVVTTNWTSQLRARLAGVK
jgi:Tol biopolymer transport system component